MIDGLVLGKLYGAPQSRIARNGSEYVTAKVRAAVGDGDAVFVNLIAFNQTAGTALLALSDGDSVALSGTLTPKAYIDRSGDAKASMDMTVHMVTTAYHVRRKRDSVKDAGVTSPVTTEIGGGEGGNRHDPFDDDFGGGL